MYYNLSVTNFYIEMPLIEKYPNVFYYCKRFAYCISIIFLRYY